jgi:hypothetical protein
MCCDSESPLYFGVETYNSFSAELQANVMARMWLLQSGIEEKSKVVFLYDNCAAANAAIGKVVSKTNRVLCKTGIAIDRLCSKLYCTLLTISTAMINILGTRWQMPYAPL